MYLCYLGVLDVIVFNVLNFVKLMKKERFGKTFICSSVALFVYNITTYFLSRNRLICQRKTKDGKNFMMWMLELFMDVDKLVDIRN